MQFQLRPIEGIISAIGCSNRKSVEDLKSCLERGPKRALYRFSTKLSLARLKRAIERVLCFYLARSLAQVFTAAVNPFFSFITLTNGWFFKAKVLCCVTKEIWSSNSLHEFLYRRRFISIFIYRGKEYRWVFSIFEGNASMKRFRGTVWND